MQSRADVVGRRPLELCLLALVLIVAALLRLENLTLEGLWLDELMAATFVPLGAKDLAVAVARFDVHPPAYNIQLNLWARLFGSSDSALLANSVFWGVATVFSVWALVRRLVGPAFALPAAALTAVAASQVYYSQELRQYAMLSGLTVAAWGVADRFAREPDWRQASKLVLLVAVLAATHAASFVPVSCVGVYIVLTVGPRRSLQWRFLRVFALMVLSLLPWLANSMIRGVAHVSPLDLDVIGTTLAGWLFGYYPRVAPAAVAAGACIVALAVALAVQARATRVVALAFLVWPMALVAVVSLLVRPLWIPRLMEFCAPFAALAVAAALVRAWQSTRLPIAAARIGVGLAAGLLVASMGAAALTQADPGRKMGYREAAAFVRERAGPDAIVYVPEHTTYWGIARYYAGPNWGSPLAIGDPVRPARSTAWDPIYARLGTERLRWLNLIPEARELRVDRQRLVIGWTPADVVESADTLWLVGSPKLPLADLSLGSLAVASVHPFAGVLVWELRGPETR
ncbi:MAG: hypothetical protein GC161_09980 [Planctomycetaceae bacterium]|nr:hypothetical protein [Planctomycetaceae bacterium]